MTDIPLEQRIEAVDIEEEVKRSYLDYAMSVIVGRALPDVRDGLKPVHRRILHSMNELGVRPGTPFKKSARVVGECFVEGALVHTPQGLRAIQEIDVGDYVLDPDGTSQLVVAAFANPPGPVVEVSFRGGHSLVVTPGQLFRVLNDDLTIEWVPAERLRGRRVIGASVRSDDDAREATQDLYPYVLGLVVAEGCPANRGREADGRVRVGMCDREPLDTCSAWAIEAGLNSTLRKQARSNPRRKDMHILTFARHEGLLDAARPHSGAKRVPAAVIEDESTWLPFLAGFLDGDGYVRTSKREIVFVTTSKTLRRQLHAMTAALGVRGHHWDRPSKNERHADLLGLTFTGPEAVRLARWLRPFVRIGYKQEALDALIGRDTSPWRSHWDAVPMEHVAAEHSRAHLGAGWYRGLDGVKFRSRLDPLGSPEVRYGRDRRGRSFAERQVSVARMRADGWIDKLRRIGSPLADRLEVLRDSAVLTADDVTPLPDPVATYDVQVAGKKHAFIVEGLVVHNCMGKFHPHGDQAIYDSLVRMAQDWAMRAPLIQGHGNFGSPDGDPPAAQRYTECRMSQAAMEMLRDITEETVDFIPNYDGEETEPVVLPARFPNLLVNGSTGIAVGMATNIPPHNLVEVVDATIAMIDNPDITAADLLKIVKGPDFPTGGIIMGRQAIKDAYTTGRGSVRVRGKATVEESKSGRQRIIITELPYMVSGDRVLAKIAEMVEKKVITGIATTRDSLKNESNRQGLRLVVELKRDAIPQVILNNLYKHTQLQDTFGVNMLALVDGVLPRTLTLQQVLQAYIGHQVEVLERRTRYRLRKAEERSHILEGYLIAFDNLDAVIALIRGSADSAAARAALMERFELSEIQANAILDMPLKRLAALERQQIIDEHAELQRAIADYKDILAKPERVRQIIKDELAEIRDKFGTERRTAIQADEGDMDIEDLIADEDVVITLTRSGYIKRVNLNVYRTQGRGGKGVRGAKPKEGDIVEILLTTTAHAYVLFFSNRGKVYRIKAHEIPEKDRTARGTSIRNLLPLSGEDSIAAVIDTRDYETHKYLVIATAKGIIKKTEFRAYDSSRRDGIIAVKLRPGDEVVQVRATSGEDEMILATRKGQSIVFSETEVRPMGRDASGVQGIRVKADDVVMAFSVVDPNGELLIVTDAGYGKRTLLTQYPRQHRGGSGVRTVHLTERKGFVAGAMMIRPGHEVFLISSVGQVIRIPCKDVRRTGRDAQGVRVMRLQAGEKVAAMAPVIAEEEGGA